MGEDEGEEEGEEADAAGGAFTEAAANRGLDEAQPQQLEPEQQGELEVLPPPPATFAESLAAAGVGRAAGAA